MVHYQLLCSIDVDRPRISDVSSVSLFRSPLAGTVRSEWINKFQRGLKERRDIDGVWFRIAVYHYIMTNYHFWYTKKYLMFLLSNVDNIMIYHWFYKELTFWYSALAFYHISIIYPNVIRIFNEVRISSSPCDIVINHDIIRIFN